MNQYWIIALLLAFAGVGVAGERYGVYSTEVTCQKHDEAQEQVTITAEKNVITTIGKQQTITTEVENAHHTGISVIDDLYRLQPANPAGNSMPAAGSTAGRPDGAACQPSRFYKLTLKECDDNTAQLIDLQTWIKNEAAAK